MISENKKKWIKPELRVISSIELSENILVPVSPNPSRRNKIPMPPDNNLE